MRRRSVDAFARFLPLCYGRHGAFTGKIPTYFDLAVIETLDTIIATPEIDVTDERLIRKEAVWIYENPAIESLAPIQKQVLRMGPQQRRSSQAAGDRKPGRCGWQRWRSLADSVYCLAARPHSARRAPHSITLAID